MTDLQLSLLVLGAVVVAGVMVFNWVQEWRFRRRSAAAFDQQRPTEDALMKATAPGGSVAPAPAARADAPPGPATSAPDKDEDWVVALSRKGVPPPGRVRRPGGDDTSAMVIDYEAVFESASTFTQPDIDDLVRAAATSIRPARVEGFEGDAARWLPVLGGGAGRYRRIRVALQLADRDACATRADLEQFGAHMEACAMRIGAELELPEPHLFEIRAKALDDLCGEVDIAVGISVVARTGDVFQGTTVRALAEAAGMRLRPEGRFHAELAGGDQFTLENLEADLFSAEGMRTLTTTGITFVLDVPRAQGGIGAYDRMVQVARQFAQSLDGTLVDDNRQKLNDSGLDATRRALAGVHATMQAQGIEPGGALALRLFA